MTTWRAPRASGSVHGRVELPGSKSITNRVLILAALADAPSRIGNPLRARDTMLMAAALRTIGVGVTDDGDDWMVRPGAMHGGTVDAGLAGTVMRFVPPVAALARGAVVIDGDAYARERPMATLLDGLRQAGVSIDDGGRNRMPFTVLGRGAVDGGVVHIDASASSQFVSGLMLAGARYDKGIEIVHTADEPVPSQPHIEMTIDVLRTAGVAALIAGPGVWHIDHGPVAGRDWSVEPDLSNAAPFLAAALITGGTVRIPRWPEHTVQPGDALRELLTRMGGDLRISRGELVARGSGTIVGIDADLRDVSELVTVVAALAAVADRPSRLTGLAHMRGHETDRLAALASELTRVGAEVDEEAGALTIHPRPLHGATWHAYADHRMATAGAVLGLVVDDIEVDDIESTTKTLPDFPGMWTALVGA